MKCHNCKAKGEVEIPGLARSLCKKCFMRVIERRIGRNVRENKLLSVGDKVAVALSGGKDSVLALNVLSKYSKKIPRMELKAIYIDRGDQFSVDSLLKAKEAAEALGIDFYSFSFENEFDILMKDIISIAKKKGVNKCAVCGVLRRRLLDSKAAELGCNKLATGHNLTDEAQSYLMNFTRGEIQTFGHLGPITLPKREGFVQRIKPLRDVSDWESKQYVVFKKWAHYELPCPCRVGSYRFNAMEQLNNIKKTCPSAEFSIVKVGDWIRSRLIAEHDGVALKKCSKCKSPCSGKVCKVCEFLDAK